MSVTTMPTMQARLSEKAATFQPARVLLTILAAPFYLVGLLVGVAWLVLSWVFAAVALGVGDARSRRGGRDT